MLTFVPGIVRGQAFALQCFTNPGARVMVMTVSYTHLDVYKRQVLNVCLCLLQGTVDGGAVVEAFGEADNLRTHEYIGTADGLFQLDAFQRGAAAEGYVCPVSYTPL